MQKITEPTIMRYDVFISYSSIDQKITEGVCAYLEQQGIRCFVAYRDIPRGVVWAKAIVEALEQSRMMVVLFSKNFNKSEQVEREIELASDSKMPILTFRLSDDDFEGAKKYYLQNLHWIDAFPNPERSFGALHRNVASLLGIPVSGGTVHVKKDPPKSPETNKSNRFLWIVIACLSVALVVALIFNNRNTSESVLVDDTADGRVKSEKIQEQKTNLSKEEIEAIYNQGLNEYNNKNYSEAVKLFKKSAEQGHAVSQSWMGYCYENGSGVKKDISEAFKWYKKSAEQGYAFSQYRLGVFYYNGTGVSKDLSEAFKWFKKSAEQGNAEAQNKIGYFYENGLGVSKDISESFKWYKKSAEQGNRIAQYNLGLCYEYGKGVSKNLSEAFKWFKKSAEQGNAEAQNKIGYFYENGLGVSKDISESFKWYKKSAEQGNRIAQYNLGLCYEYGKGVSKDLSEAFNWYMKSAGQGYAKAQNQIGYFYELGKGVSKDVSEAIKWYKKSAEQGYSIAQYNLGICYEYGKGVSKDVSEAIKWYKKAADQGDEDAKKALQRLEKQ